MTSSFTWKLNTQKIPLQVVLLGTLKKSIEVLIYFVTMKAVNF